jgi:adenosylcobinamide-GDP ribazoletransferase
MELINASALIFMPIVSRCCSSLALNTFKKISESQYVGVAKNKGQIVVLTAQLLLILVLSFIVCGKKAIAVLAVIAGYALALSKAYKSLEGVNGDVAGYALTISEFCGVLVLALL